MPLSFTLAAQTAQVLGGRRSGQGWVARCPAHNDGTPSLSINDGSDGRLLVHCHAGCDGSDVLAELRRRGLAGDYRRPDTRSTPRLASRPALLPPYDRIRELLRRSQPLAGTLAERYLVGRGLDVGLVDAEALRFLPATAAYPPAMLSVVTPIADASRIVGLQMTSLRPDGTRGERRFLTGSRVTGAVVRLTDDADVTYDLGVTEGAETALAVMTAMRRAGRMVLPMWAALSAGTLASLPVLPGIERLFIHADLDESGTGQRAAETLAQRWADVGREAFIRLPAQGDWNE